MKMNQSQMPKIYLARDHLLRATFIGWTVWFLAGCSQIINREPPSATATQSISISPTRGEINQMTPSLSTPANPGLQGLIQTAKTDLAERLAVPVATIILLEAVPVVWPDSSLGCPQEGMFYTQVLTDGYLIRLEAEGNIYEYHANRDTYVFLCENPSSPVPGIPGDR